MLHFQIDEILNEPEVLDVKSKINLFSNKIKSLSEGPTQPFLQRRNSTSGTRTATRNTQPQTRFTCTGSLQYPYRKPKLLPSTKHPSLAQKNEDQTGSNENSVLTNSSFLSNVRSKDDVNNYKHYSQNIKIKNYDGKATNEKGKFLFLCVNPLA